MAGAHARALADAMRAESDGQCRALECFDMGRRVGGPGSASTPDESAVHMGGVSTVVRSEAGPP